MEKVIFIYKSNKTKRVLSPNKSLFYLKEAFIFLLFGIYLKLSGYNAVIENFQKMKQSSKKRKYRKNILNIGKYPVYCPIAYYPQIKEKSIADVQQKLREIFTCTNLS